MNIVGSLWIIEIKCYIDACRCVRGVWKADASIELQGQVSHSFCW